jgi:signal transduction histidine kinase
LIFHVDRPLKTIEDAIQKISVGDYTNIPAIATGDEFEALVVSLNKMIYELNRRSEQLLQTKKLASLGTLTSGVAHELNNPLNNISTSVQILLEEIEEPDLEFKKELLQDTERQIVRARDIVRALLEFSRERSFSLEEVDFRKLVDDTIKLLKSELPANIDLKVEVPHGIHGRMDPRRMQQVLLNLMINGVQAMEDGGLLVVSASAHKPEGKFCIQVQDTGQGISKENIAKIFDPFFTTKDTSTNSVSNEPSCHGIVEQRGSGLGLAICHSIVEKHGGHIEVESEAGEGTTFRVCLPWGKTDDGEATEEQDLSR